MKILVSGSASGETQAKSLPSMKQEQSSTSEPRDPHRPQSSSSQARNPILISKLEMGKTGGDKPEGRHDVGSRGGKHTPSPHPGPHKSRRKSGR